MSAPEPAAHRDFLERLTESTAEIAPGRLTVGERGNRISVLGASEMARRLPGVAGQYLAALLRRASGGQLISMRRSGH